MIRIAIADDEKEFVEKIEKIIRQFFSTRNEEYKIEKYLLSGELMVDVEEGKYFDIYLIDIEMPTVNGWSLASVIREKYNEPYIIFVTSHPEYSMMGYEYGAWRYITKDTLHEKLPLAFEALIKKMESDNRKYYLIEMPSRSFTVDYNDIYYLHKEGKYTEVYTNREVVKVRKAINKVYNELNDSEFMFVDRSHVVNVRHVVSLEEKTITMRDGANFVIGNTQYRKVRNEFNGFWRDKG